MTVLAGHRRLALGLGILLVIHTLGHLAGLWGQKEFDALQSAMRPYYRNLWIEPLLLAAVALQVALGGYLAAKKWRRPRLPMVQRLQFWSGVILALFLVQHIAALFFARGYMGLDTTFWWPSSVASQFPAMVYFIPYYFLGVWSLFVHIGCGVNLVLRRRGAARAAGWALWGAGTFGAIIAFLIVLGLSGALYPITLPSEWQG